MRCRRSSQAAASGPRCCSTPACAAAIDVVRAVALGAQAAFAGKAFLWGLGALGADGPGHVIDLLIDEVRAVARADRRAFAGRGARRSSIRHPGRLALLSGDDKRHWPRICVVAQIETWRQAPINEPGAREL